MKRWSTSLSLPFIWLKGYSKILPGNKKCSAAKIFPKLGNQTLKSDRNGPWWFCSELFSPCLGIPTNLCSLTVLMIALCSIPTACWYWSPTPLEISQVCPPFSPPGKFLMIQLKPCSHSSPWERNLQKSILHKSLLQSLAHHLPPPPDHFPYGREWVLTYICSPACGPESVFHEMLLS